MTRVILIISIFIITALSCRADCSYATTKHLPKFDYHAKPQFTPAAAKFAIKLFHIEIPENVVGLGMDVNEPERASTRCSPIIDECMVVLGPSAFDSWALLGSTLAHELEVHCRQPIFLITILGTEGVNIAEKQAYDYELRNAKRFHLSKEDIADINKIIDYAYPTTRENTYTNQLYWLMLKPKGY